MIAYFDSSGLVKLLISSEVGAELASMTIRGADYAFTSVVAYPECRAAIAAALRGSRLDSPRAQDAVNVLENLWLILAHALVSDDIARRAGELAARHRLRGFDAVHLASALTFGVGVTMVYWDRDLAAAALAEGLAVLPSPT